MVRERYRIATVRESVPAPIFSRILTRELPDQNDLNISYVGSGWAGFDQVA
jgi:hypothetical protein